MSTILHRFRSVVFFLVGFCSFIGAFAQSTSKSVTLGQTFSLSVTADGTAPFSYQWFHDGVVMPGVTGAIYSRSGAQASDAGVYYAVVSNTAGSTDSASVSLMVNVTPVFSLQPASQTVTAGASVNFTAAASGSPAPVFQWLKNGINIVGATSASYAISNTTSGDAGTYSVVASNSAGAVTSTDAVLMVNAAAVAPVITAQPASQAVTTGASVVFTVTASGSPALAFQWLKNGVNIVGATSASYAISSASSVDVGTYTVVASNSAGAVTSSGATLTVSAPTVAPVITTQPVSQTTTVGANVTFTVAASGSPAPAYQWRKDGINVVGANGSSYSFTVTSSNAGTYSVVASNSAGAATSSGAVLTVNTATSAPVFTTQPISKTVKTGVSVTFIALASGTPTPTYQWCKNGAAISGATSSSYTIASVANGSAGTYTVVATNSVGSATSTSAILTIDTGVALARVDFNGDGKTDILWQNIVSRESTVWYMKGTNQNNSASLGVFSSEWKMAGASDFDGNGKPDILCQNTVTGEYSIWLMSDRTLISKVSLGIQTLDWQISAIGDFNGDHRPDIVVQNSVTGEVVVWLMAGTSLASKVSLGIAAPDYQVCASGDFNADGKSDLVWQNSVTGECNLWLMSGTTVTWKSWITTVSPAWQISGSGDFNGDGKSDILCQNVLTGECSLWLMSTNNISRKISLGTQAIDWVIRN